MVSKEEMLARMREDAERNGFSLCPDAELLDELMGGLVKNEDRFGYGCCPCRIPSGIRDYDVDIICPCEYRDADVNEFGMCYCGLFVSEKVKDDPKRLRPIPERRPEEVVETALRAKEARDRGELPVAEKAVSVPAGGGTKGIPVWRCQVCGYLAARDMPPPVCPICKAKRERFERFSFG